MALPTIKGVALSIHRYVDLATLDIVVNVEGPAPTYHARIRVPARRTDELLRFCKSFSYPDVEVRPHAHAHDWVEITFPVAPEIERASR